MDFDDEEFKRYKLERGDILVCEGGEVGRTAIYNGEISNCCYQNALHRLRIKSKSIEPFYFVYYMMLASKYGLIERDTIQVTIAHFTLEKFKKFRVPLPPIALQQEFSAIVEKTESVKEKQKKSREEIDNLFNSLMQRAFNGGLVK
jgi:type I restriction enzyme S subunit